MTHGHHIYSKALYMAMAKMSAYTQPQHSFPHWKYELRCCANCPCIDIPYQESKRHHSSTSPSIHFHIYHLTERCAVHGRRPLDEKKCFLLCLQDKATVSSEKLYTRKEFLMMETSILNFHTSFYIPEIKI